MNALKPCVVCQSLPYSTEGQAHLLARHYAEKLHQSEQVGLSRLIELTETRERLAGAEERISDLEATVARLNARVRGRTA